MTEPDQAPATTSTGMKSRPRRQRTTRPMVKIMDTFWRIVISIGGVATIFAVIGVCLFLFGKTVPLFLPASIEREADLETALQEPSSPLLTCARGRVSTNCRDAERKWSVRVVVAGNG